MAERERRKSKRRLPSNAELDAIEAAWEEAYPWFIALWPLCVSGKHYQIHLGQNPEPFIYYDNDHMRCRRCRRDQTNERRRRERENR